MGEFDLIARYFTRPARPGGAVALGVGDDCALLAPTPGMQLAISSDMLVEGRHFFADVDPEALGHKALAVNLSDLAACGARPLAFTLALSLPRVDEAWLEGFSRGMWALADTHGCELVGGDTTQGPLNLCITRFCEPATGEALLRTSAGVVHMSRSELEARLQRHVLLARRVHQSAKPKGRDDWFWGSFSQSKWLYAQVLAAATVTNFLGLSTSIFRCNPAATSGKPFTPATAIGQPAISALRRLNAARRMRRIWRRKCPLAMNCAITAWVPTSEWRTASARKRANACTSRWGSTR